jgi:sigma-B regulation protein RsbU (phosphoserine phosphatase)
MLAPVSGTFTQRSVPARRFRHAFGDIFSFIPVSNSAAAVRRTSRGGEMTANEIETGEWMAAREVQQRFMKSAGPVRDELDFSARCRQAGEVGGDFYTLLAVPRNCVALAVGDASGKGLAAALMMSSVHASLRTALSFTGGDGCAALAAVNHEVYSSSSPNRYATLFFGVFDSATRTLRYVNAGHNPPLVIRRGRPARWLHTGGAPVGMFPEWPYEEGIVQLHPGDTVIAYTDGIIEAVNQAGEQWGVDGLEKAARESRAGSADAIVEDIFAAMDDCSWQTDDATVAVLRIPEDAW